MGIILFEEVTVAGILSESPECCKGLLRIKGHGRGIIGCGSVDDKSVLSCPTSSLVASLLTVINQVH